MFLSIACLLAACQTTPAPSQPPVANLTVHAELPLAPGQSAAVTNTDLTITFHSIVSDERCPSESECLTSGPVTVSLSIQQGDNPATGFTLQTFTDENGRSPNVQFEGITNRAEVGEYLVQIASVTPYPEERSTPIEPAEYRLTLWVLK